MLIMPLSILVLLFDFTFNYLKIDCFSGLADEQWSRSMDQIWWGIIPSCEAQFSDRSLQLTKPVPTHLSQRRTDFFSGLFGL